MQYGKYNNRMNSTIEGRRKRNARPMFYSQILKNPIIYIQIYATCLHDEELHSLSRSPNIVRVIESRRLRWTGHVARMEEGRNAVQILTI